MAIVNLTPDSFSDGGQCASPTEAIERAQQALEEGADLLDLGAESSRPGAQPVSAEEEWRRLQPVLHEVVRWGVPVSVDTYKPETMQRALDAGCDIVNDIWALRHPPEAPGTAGAWQVVRAHPDCGLCLMHMHRDPATMQQQPLSDPAVPQVLEFLKQRLQEAQAIGLDLNRIVLDPGIGFGKTPQQNLQLLARQEDLLALGRPLLVGWSRKSTLGWVLEDGASAAPPSQVRSGRLHASVAAAVLAVQHGARVVRVHDVAPTVQALKLWCAVRAA